MILHIQNQQYKDKSSKRKAPNAYPTSPPITDDMVVIKDKYFHSCGNLRDIGINKTSAGIGKKIDSIKLINDKRVLIGILLYYL